MGKTELRTSLSVSAAWHSTPVGAAFGLDKIYPERSYSEPGEIR
jgi:hypothetical protein